jgi:hypothetical protein
MKVSELFYILSVGELSNLAISNEGSGTIREKDTGKLITYINSGLDLLYKRFILSTDELILELYDWITSYNLRKEFAMSSGSKQKYKYILDLPEHPYMENVVQVVEVWDALRHKLPLNDPGRHNSVYTPSPLVLQVPNPINGQYLSVVYQAKAKPLKALGLSQDDLIAQEIPLPDFLISALTNHVAFKVYNHMNGQDHSAKAQDYFALFEADCTLIEEKDLVSQTQSNTTTKLEERGFV